MGPLLELKQITKQYPTSFPLRGKGKGVEALRDVSLSIKEGEIIGLVGQSGSGKSTLGEIILQLEKPTEGHVMFAGKNLSTVSKKARKQMRRDIQMVFQDPYETMHPSFTVFDTIAEPLRIHGWRQKEQIRKKVYETLAQVELSPVEDYINRFPHELSGGQLQRIAIARAIVLNPRFLVADEPVSMLDVSIRAGILHLLKQLNDTFKLTMLYISHDLSTVSYLCDRLAVLYKGEIVEIGPTKKVLESPQHPYTQALLTAIPMFPHNRSVIV
ncbi:hypothetical protein BEP19_11470 [Ammoniphilus oxalaticus]|uniref:ABC transporter domain-containing protein n=1 Tax=Ammoniphilus oxalaticus TaxID=66863 RepID=A0A419SGE2_9BACL|nr:ATP-binding cassette domain-containing protein [Ammoniphilus oxalaticus]RKD22853.1 hypothetical protein BEP19_11470 [Ammoniphilus oxalaticus]